MCFDTALKKSFKISTLDNTFVFIFNSYFLFILPLGGSTKV